MIQTKGGRWVNVGFSGNVLEVKLFQGTHHFEIFFETLSSLKRNKNVIIKKLLNNYLGIISNLS